MQYYDAEKFIIGLIEESGAGSGLARGCVTQEGIRKKLLPVGFERIQRCVPRNRAMEIFRAILVEKTRNRECKDKLQSLSVVAQKERRQANCFMFITLAEYYLNKVA